MSSPTIFPSVTALEAVEVHDSPLGGSCTRCSKHAKVTGFYIHSSGTKVPIWLCLDHATEYGVVS